MLPSNGISFELLFKLIVWCPPCVLGPSCRVVWNLRRQSLRSAQRTKDAARARGRKEESERSRAHTDRLWVHWALPNHAHRFTRRAPDGGCLYICISIYRSIGLSIYLSIYPSIHLSLYLSIYLSIHLSIYLSISLYIYRSIYLSICICIYRYVYLYTYLYLYIYITQTVCGSIEHFRTMLIASHHARQTVS